MAPEEASGSAQVNRIFEQATDAISLYSDFANVIGTGHEVILQFYETIPGTPGPGGQIQILRTRLRATITVGIAHAANIGRLLITQSEKPAAKPQAKQGERQP